MLWSNAINMETEGRDSSSRKSTVLCKIEFVCLNLVWQLLRTPPPTRLVLKAVEDDAQKQIMVLSRQGIRLAYMIQCLAQIYKLVTYDQQSTKRDLYYEQKKLYKKQSNLDRTISSICELLDEPRVSLNIISSSKGLLFGDLVFMTKEEKMIDCRSQPVLISESLKGLRIISDVQFILVVEKDAIFQKLINEGYFQCFPKTLLVTGRGYPDICTRKILQWIVDELAVPIYGLFDSDPHGIEIMLTYKYGSNSYYTEDHRSYVRQIQWLGFKPSDISLLPIMSHHFLKLCNSDFMKIRRIRRRAQGLREYNVVEELSILKVVMCLDVLRLLRTKLELEAVSTIAPQFIIRIYLKPRLARLLGPSCGLIPSSVYKKESHESANDRKFSYVEA
ncbi:type IIB DNA topoisomerase [Dictyocaulus viviparus]|uniref:DNA topoisomerase (ATP-hydrolyzing) n=1 Tax=Dictyocaulus viviparus TaxID=29172 RepID=A0A0D8XZ05_DICVI|nr:type IIB DNA topoisomerase [Dictyocaulus viviparus]